MISDDPSGLLCGGTFLGEIDENEVLDDLGFGGAQILRLPCKPDAV